jgi:hypothetical protein
VQTINEVQALVDADLTILSRDLIAQRGRIDKNVIG